MQDHYKFMHKTLDSEMVATERMRIDSSGRLGVGCTPTGYATEIQATTGGNGLKYKRKKCWW